MHSSKRSQRASGRSGCGPGWPAPYVAEILAGAGFNWIVIDGEHAPNDISTLLPQLQAMRGGTAEPVFRVPWNEPVIIKRALDVGARSLLVPFVQNVDEARRAVAATRYPPLGIRGVAVGPRANDFGRIQNYHRNAHLDTCVLVQIETTRRAEGDRSHCRRRGRRRHLHRSQRPGRGLRAISAIPSTPTCRRPIKRQRRASAPRANRQARSRLERGRRGIPVELGFNFTAAGSDVGILARGAEAIAARFQKH